MTPTTKVNDLLYMYRVTDVIAVHDGDTFKCHIDLGFKLRMKITVRLLDLDAIEIVDSAKLKRQCQKLGITEKQGLEIAKKQRDELSKLLYNAKEIILHFKDFDAFGRALVLVYCDNALVSSNLENILESEIDKIKNNK